MATPEEIDAALNQAKPLFEKMEQRYAAENNKWANEIATLERRVNTLYEDVDLGNGDRIAIRTALSEKESKRVGKLEEERTTLDKEHDLDRLNDISYELLEIFTANPMLTKTWFKKNGDKFALNDALKIMFSFYESLVRRAGQTQQIEKFRPDE
jgi:Na+/phosphate symporter